MQKPRPRSVVVPDASIVEETVNRDLRLELLGVLEGLIRKRVIIGLCHHTAGVYYGEYDKVVESYLLSRRRAGDFPKTHYLRDLFDRLLDVYGDVCGLGDFIKRWKRFMAVLEVAYTAARYLLYKARKEDVDDAMAFVEEALGVFKCLES